MQPPPETAHNCCVQLLAAGTTKNSDRPMLFLSGKENVATYSAEPNLVAKTKSMFWGLPDEANICEGLEMRGKYTEIDHTNI